MAQQEEVSCLQRDQRSPGTTCSLRLMSRSAAHHLHTYTRTETKTQTQMKLGALSEIACAVFRTARMRHPMCCLYRIVRNFVCKQLSVNCSKSTHAWLQCRITVPIPCQKFVINVLCTVSTKFESHFLCTTCFVGKKKNSKLIFQLQFFAAAAAADELSWGSSRPRARGRRKTNSFCNSLLQAWTKAARLVKSRLITRQTFAVRGSFRGVRVVSPLKPKHRDTDSSTKAL